MKRLTILIIDDSPTDREIFAAYMQKDDYQVNIRQAETGKQGLDMIASAPHLDCIFLDYNMPDRNGIEVLKALQDPVSGLMPFPVVMLTGEGSESLLSEAIHAGALDYIEKSQMSSHALYIAMLKAQQAFELKRKNNETLNLLSQSQKMEAVGNLTGGIAHDFNNLLTIMFGNVRAMRGALKSSEFHDKAFIEKELEKLNEAVRRGATLIKHLMVFSRQRTLEPTTIDMNESIVEICTLMKRTLGNVVEIDCDLAENSQSIDVDPGQFENAMINLCVNARDAMPDGGKITLATKTDILSDDDAAFFEIDPGSYVVLSVKDTGVGMSDDQLDKIFDPFYTTKDVNKGTGLGLSMVYGFVRDSGGTIDVYSEKGEGTVFSMYFPISESAGSQAFEPGDQSQDDAHDLTGRQEIVFVVEDEPNIRMSTCLMLQDAGYQVIEAEDAQHALQVLQDYDGDEIDLLFTDIAMPGEMNGVQLAARVQSIKPQMRLLFTTGFARGAIPDIELAEQYPLIHKPYEYDDLVKKVREVLDEPLAA